MKKRRRADRGVSRAGRGAADLGADFVRGFVATGLLSVLQDRGALPLAGLEARRALRHALQGGVALAAGAVAARAVHRRDYTIAMGAVVAGAAAVHGIERWLPSRRRLVDQEV